MNARLSLVALAIIASSLVACGNAETAAQDLLNGTRNQTPTPAAASPTPGAMGPVVAHPSTEDGFLAVGDEYDLPSCLPGNYGELALVQAEGQTYVCTGAAWVPEGDAQEQKRPAQDGSCTAIASGENSSASCQVVGN